MHAGLQEANLLVGLEKHRAQTSLAEHPYDVQDCVLPRFAFCLAMSWLWVLCFANVSTDVVALVRRFLALAVVAVRGVVVATLAAVVAVVYQGPQVLQSVLDLIGGHLQLVDGTFNRGLLVNADLDGGAASADSVEVVNHHDPTVDVCWTQSRRHAQIIHARWPAQRREPVADILPGVLKEEVPVPEVTADGVGVLTARALVDVDAAAFCGGTIVSAIRVQTLCEQPAEHLR